MSDAEASLGLGESGIECDIRERSSGSEVELQATSAADDPGSRGHVADDARREGYIVGIFWNVPLDLVDEKLASGWTIADGPNYIGIHHGEHSLLMREPD